MDRRDGTGRSLVALAAIVAGLAWSALAARTGACDETVVVTLAGESIRGELRELDAGKIAVDVAGARREWPSEQLRRVEFPSSNQTARPGPVVVHLIDDSTLAGSQFVTERASGTLSVGEDRAIPVRTSAIRRILLADLGNNDSLRRQWEELAAAKTAKDVLVFRRDGQTGPRLDSLEGIVFEIRPDAVVFEYDGERIQPKRERVVGIVFFHPQQTEGSAPAVCRIQDANGSEWNAKDVRLADGVLEWTTVAGVAASAPTATIRSIDFSSVNLSYLSDLAPQSQTWRPFVESKIAESLLARRYAARRDESFDGGPLLLANRQFEKGLAIHSYGELVYRLPPGFRRFQAIAGIDDRARKSGVNASVRLKILVDQTVAHDRVVTSRDEPYAIDLDIARANRLRIIVDFGDDLDISDYLNLGEARLTR
ncbi:MAG: hypothetical protein FJ297_04900 [Planctomycetes bacterium]|nr:hypothetical protein [Planctomycetota bacterium]